MKQKRLIGLCGADLLCFWSGMVNPWMIIPAFGLFACLIVIPNKYLGVEK
jgi:hypothetical protein